MSLLLHKYYFNQYIIIFLSVEFGYINGVQYINIYNLHLHLYYLYQTQLGNIWFLVMYTQCDTLSNRNHHWHLINNIKKRNLCISFEKSTVSNLHTLFYSTEFLKTPRWPEKFRIKPQVQLCSPQHYPPLRR